jgi:hypothetical protein
MAESCEDDCELLVFSKWCTHFFYRLSNCQLVLNVVGNSPEEINCLWLRCGHKNFSHLCACTFLSHISHIQLTSAVDQAMDTHLTSIVLFVSQNSTYSEEMNSLHSECVCVCVWMLREDRVNEMVKEKETRNAVSFNTIPLSSKGWYISVMLHKSIKHYNE